MTIIITPKENVVVKVNFRIQNVRNRHVLTTHIYNVRRVCKTQKFEFVKLAEETACIEVDGGGGWGV